MILCYKDEITLELTTEELKECTDNKTIQTLYSLFVGLIKKVEDAKCCGGTNSCCEKEAAPKEEIDEEDDGDINSFVDMLMSLILKGKEEETNDRINRLFPKNMGD